MIERSKTGSAGLFTKLIELPPDAQGYINNGLLSETEYSYRAHAVKGAVPSSHSNSDTAVTFTQDLALELFSVIVLPDTQKYAESFPEIFTAQTQWIVDEKAAFNANPDDPGLIAKNIAFTTQLGDCVETASQILEWQRADAAFSLLEDPQTTGETDGAAYGIAVGNHDQFPQASADPQSTTTNYNSFFGESRFFGRAYYGGNDDDVNGHGHDNHFELFDAGGLQFVIVHVEYDSSGPDQDVLDWVKDVVQVQQPGRWAIVVTHHMLGAGFNAPFSSQGQRLYDTLESSPNLFLMLGGHVPGEGQRVETRQGLVDVNVLLSDYQSRVNGGDGFLRILEFQPDDLGFTIDVKTFQVPHSGNPGAFETDPDSQFTLSFPVTGPPPLSPTIAPTITQDPADQTVTEGESATFSVVASGDSPLSYQWRQNSTDIPGATSLSYTLDSTVVGDSGAFFDVVVSNAAGSVTSNPASLTVTPEAPIAGFTFDPSSGDAPLTVSFTDISSGEIDSWDWNFGDGGTSSAQSPSHTYTATGSYTVTLTLAGPGGSDATTCSDCVTVTEPPPPPPEAPIADFTFNPPSGDAPLTVDFVDLSTGAIDSWDWNFGDGGTSSEQNPSYTYTAAGNYTVTLTVTNTSASDTVTCNDCITVTEPPPPPPVAPIADFTFNPSSGEAPLAVSFTDISGGAIDSWNWNFGDGDTSSAQSPSHTYTAAGNYTVTLTVTGPGGSDTVNCFNCIAITEPPPPPPAAPIADFTLSEIGGEAPVTVAFTDLSTGAIDTWDWNFGDSGTSSEQNPSHTYTEEGSYTVTLTVTGPGGSDTATCPDCVLVFSPPEPPEPTPASAKIYISFKGTASVPGVGTVRDEDIVSFDPDTNQWEMYFDGSDVGLASTDVDAFSVRADGSIVLSVNSGSFSVTGLIGGPSGTTIDDSDMIEFTPVATGNTTAGSFTFLFDGSDVGLTTNGEDIDGVCWLEDGTFLFSTQGTARGNGPRLADEDVAVFFPSALGSTTGGTWEKFFDGSNVGYSQSSQEDIDGFSLTEDQSLLMSTVGSASASGVSGSDEDLFLFSGTFGSPTSGSSSIAFILSSLGIDTSEDVDGVSNR